MHKMLSDFFNIQENNKKTEEELTKQKTLIRLGLFEKEYSPENKYTSEYSFSEFDVNTNSYKYFRKIPIHITDEEYKKLKEYINTQEKNSISSLLISIACIIYVCGFIGGIASDSLVLFLSIFGASFISGSLFLGISEIINLLTDIKNK